MIDMRNAQSRVDSLVRFEYLEELRATDAMYQAIYNNKLITKSPIIVSDFLDDRTNRS